MKVSRSQGLPTMVALGLSVFVVAGCSSSASPVQGAPDSGAPGMVTPGDEAGAPVGAPCASAAECPSGDECSNAVYAAGNPLFPTSICVSACTPGDSSQGIAYCGSDSLPGEGLCRSLPSAGGEGICLPVCEVTPAGTVVGCEANDVCQILGSNPPDGIGWCQPGCTATSQCPTETVCDPLLAACVGSPVVTTLPIGAPCSLTASPSPCNCVGTSTGTTGYCTAACVTGATLCPSPGFDGGIAMDSDAGDASPSTSVALWVCSAGLGFLTATDGVALFTSQPAGLFGFCTPPCNTDEDCASFAGTCVQGDPAAPPGFTGTCATND